MKRYALAVLIVALIISLFFTFNALRERETLFRLRVEADSQARNAQATAVVETTLRATAEAYALAAENTAVAESQRRATMETQAEEWQAEMIAVEATAVYESALRATAEALLVNIAPKEQAHRLALEAALLLNEQPAQIERSALLAIEAVQSYWDEHTIQVLRDVLLLLPRYEAQIFNVPRSRFYNFAYSADGRFIAGQYVEDESVQIFDARTGEPITRLDVDSATHFILSSNGNYAAIADLLNRTVSVHNVMTGAVVLQNLGLYTVNFVFSPDNTQLGHIGRENEGLIFQLWDIESGNEVLRKPVTNYAFVFSPDGQAVYTINNGIERTDLLTGNTGKIETSVDDLRFNSLFSSFSPLSSYFVDGNQILFLETREAVPLQFPRYSGFPTLFTFSSDERFLAATSQEGGTSGLVFGYNNVNVWDVETGSLCLTLEEAANDLAFSPDGRYFAVAIKKVVRVWDTSNFQEVARIGLAHPYPQIAFTSDGHGLIVVHSDYQNKKTVANLWNLDVGQTERHLRHHDELRRIDTVAFSPDGNVLATGGQSPFVHLWDVATGSEIGRLDHGYSINTLAFSPDSQYLLVGSGSLPRALPVARLWHVATETAVITTTTTTDENVIHGAFTRDGAYFAYVNATYTDTVHIFETATREEVATIEDIGYLGMSFSPDGRYLAAAGYNSIGSPSAGVWEVRTGQQVLPLAGLFQQIVFSPDGRHVAGIGLSPDNTPLAKVLALPTGEELITFPLTFAADEIVYSPDGRNLAIAGGKFSSGHLSVWDLENQMEIITLSQPGGVKELAFSPDGRYLAFASEGYYDGSVMIWDVIEKRLVDRIVADYLYTVTFSPDGKHLLIQDYYTNVYLWRWQADDLIAEACSRLSRNLTPEEWHVYFSEEAYRPTCPNLFTDGIRP